ncbi:hypothetical protein DL240_19085 [Lujinxingia litoralis]|uniref:Right handed beta helix domain-containing protein n=1 Tax=Lujinxingia litoralis TaxID=2211119 RepID=A0A328C3Z0_9DELT|nr:hypothetical protein DL240_19085 [Lujinxingia litoralis]
MGDTTLSVPEGGILDAIPVGQYQVVAQNMVLDLATYNAPVANLTIEADQHVELTLSYALLPASWQVIIEGLPGTLTPQVNLSGPNTDVILNASALFDDLTPGTYHLTPQQVSDGTTTYHAAVRTAALTSGANDPTTITYGLANGQLQVSFQGLPAGVSPTITISGPGGYSATVNSATTLQDLVPGIYVVSAADVTQGDLNYSAPPQSVEVLSDAIASAHLNFGMATGQLNVVTQGLPAGAAASVTLTGPAPSTAQTTYPDVTNLPGLAPGQYTLTFHNVNAGGSSYEPATRTTTASVQSGQTTHLTQTYAALDGGLALSHDLPSTGSLTIRVASAGISHSRQLSGQGTAHIPLDPGTWSLSVSVNQLGTDAWGNVYTVVGGSQTLTVQEGQTTFATISSPKPTLVTDSGDSATTYGTLREVLGRVAAGSVITFAPSISEITLSSELSVDKEVRIEGPGTTGLTLRSAGNARHFNVAASGDLHLEGLTLRDGATSEYGGAVYAEGSFGGTDLDFINNTSSQRGGALYLETGTVPGVLRRVRFIDNETHGQGGAIFVDAPLLLEDALFKNNYAESSGGAIFANALGTAGNLVIVRALFNSNETPASGGAVYSRRGAFVLHTTFYDNTANSIGGAWYQYDGQAAFMHTTFDFNTGGLGSAIASTCDTRTPVYLKNSVVLDDTEPFHCGNSDHLIDSLGYNYIRLGSEDFTPDSVTDAVGTEIQPLPVRLQPLANNGGFTRTKAVSPGATNDVWMRLPASHCVDHQGEAFTEDQRGMPRPNGGYCSIGAWENTAR